MDMNTDIYQGHLYHGTDKKILEMGKEERNERLILCRAVADYSYSILEKRHVAVSGYTEQHAMNKQLLSDIWFKFCNFGLIPYTASKSNSKLYQYGALYVTNSKARAEGYARNSHIYGESGNVAYWLYQGAKRFDEFYSNATDDILLLIKRFEEWIAERHEPVVVIMDGIRKDSLLGENGCDIDWGLFEEDFLTEQIVFSFRIPNTKEYDLSKMNYYIVLP